MVEVLQIALRDHLVEVFQALPVEDQQRHVPGLFHVRAAQRVIDGLDVVHGPRALRGEHRQEFRHDARDDHRVVRGAVVVELRQAQMVRDDIQFEALELRAKGLGEGERVEKDRGEADPVPPGGGAEEADVEMGVVGDQRAVSGKVQKHPQRLVLARRALYVALADAGQLRDIRGDGHLRVDEGVELLYDLAAGEDHGADLGHAVIGGVEAGGLDIEGDKLAVERHAAFADDGAVAVHVVGEVALHAVDDLDAVFLSRFPHVREGLRDAVVCHGDGRHAPVCRALDDLLRIGERVEGGEARVHVQLHAFFRRVVGADGFFALHDAARIDNKVVVIFAEDDLALHEKVHAGPDRVDDRAVVVRAQEFAHTDRAGVVGHVEAQHRAAVFHRTAGNGDHVAFDADLAGVHPERAHLDGLRLDGLAHEHAALRRLAGARRGADGGGRGGLLARIVRDDRRAGKRIITLEPLGEQRDIRHGGHGREERIDCEDLLGKIDLQLGDTGLVQTAAAVPEIGAAGEHRQKGSVLAHLSPSSSIMESSAPKSSS